MSVYRHVRAMEPHHTQYQSSGSGELVSAVVKGMDGIEGGCEWRDGYGPSRVFLRVRAVSGLEPGRVVSITRAAESCSPGPESIANCSHASACLSGMTVAFASLSCTRTRTWLSQAIVVQSVLIASKVCASLQRRTAPGEKAQKYPTRVVTARRWLVIPGRWWAKCRQTTVCER